MSIGIRKKDTVQIIKGKDAAQKGEKARGEVKYIDTQSQRIIVEGQNIVKRHVKAGRAKQSGILEQEASIHISNVVLICPNCNKPSRVGNKKLENGSKVRICKRCKGVIE
jgi:large subunit ribosomal protein L24